jgi:hypothetical protein
MFSFITENRCILVGSIALHSTYPVFEYDHTKAMIAKIFPYFVSILSGKIQIQRFKRRPWHVSDTYFQIRR